MGDRNAIISLRYESIPATSQGNIRELGTWNVPWHCMMLWKSADCRRRIYRAGKLNPDLFSGAVLTTIWIQTARMGYVNGLLIASWGLATGTMCLKAQTGGQFGPEAA